MTDRLHIKDVTFTYRGKRQPALDHVDFSIKEGEFVAIAGETGAGKSTLVRSASGIVPRFFNGSFAGEVSILGIPLGKRRVAELAGTIGTVFQDFESQLFSTNARLECAFGMENIGIDRKTMIERIERIAKLVGMQDLLDREPQTLSGGEKQRLALASVLCLEPEILLCDEPTTDLDPVGKRDVFKILDHLTEAGHSVGIVEHETRRLLKADRIVVLRKGKVVAQGNPENVLSDPDFCEANGICAPPLFELFARLGLKQRPLDPVGAANILKSEGFQKSLSYQYPPQPTSLGRPQIQLDQVRFGYTPREEVLDDVSVEISEGEFVALLGKNGSGKTTLVKQINGLLTPCSGLVQFENEPVSSLGIAKLGRKVGFVFQNPDQMLFCPNAFEEVAFGLRNFKVDPTKIPSRVSEALTTVGLAKMEASDPFLLTKGERQKLALACVLACKPKVLILDEPTTGLDSKEQSAMRELLIALNRQGHTILIITHSVEMAAACAQRTIVMDSGRIIADGPTRDIFKRQDLLERASLIPPDCMAVGREFGVSALTVNELISGIERGRQ